MPEPPTIALPPGLPRYTERIRKARSWTMRTWMTAYGARTADHRPFERSRPLRWHDAAASGSPSRATMVASLGEGGHGGEDGGARMTAFSAATAKRASIERLIAYPTTRRDQASRMAAI